MSVLYEQRDNIAIVTLDRPEKHNALTEGMLDQLREAWERARDDDSVRAVVLASSSDKAFCAGADIVELLGREAPLSAVWNPDRDLRPDRGLDLWKPVVSAVEGICFGGGLTLLLATDLRVAGQSARFAAPEVKWGVIASCGGTQRIMRELPPAIAMEMLLIGDPIQAEQAYKWGLLNRVVPDGQALAMALEIAKRVVANAPLAVQATKELASRSFDVPGAVGLRYEDMVVRILQNSEDFAEGMAAFADRRAGEFEGR